MPITWTHALRMGSMMQIRNVPADVHRTLKARAAMAGLSLSDYVLAELTQIAQHPTREEILARIAQRPSVAARPRPAEVIRAERDGR